MFDPVSPQVSFPKLDGYVQKRWDEARIFEASIEQSAGKPPFIFYEGPPTANGMPHAGHVLTRVMKDVFLRYKQQCAATTFRAARAGIRTGLPVEVEVEKELGISGRDAIQPNTAMEAVQPSKCIEIGVQVHRRMAER